MNDSLLCIKIYDFVFGNTSKTYYYSCLSLNCSAMTNLDINIMLLQCIYWVNHVIYLYSGFERG